MREIIEVPFLCAKWEDKHDGCAHDGRVNVYAARHVERVCGDSMNFRKEHCC